MKKKIIAFIFMREGSTRLKNKNIKIFNKKPLFMNSIHQVKKVKLITKLALWKFNKWLSDLRSVNNVSLKGIFREFETILKKVTVSKYILILLLIPIYLINKISLKKINNANNKIRKILNNPFSMNLNINVFEKLRLFNFFFK